MASSSLPHHRLSIAVPPSPPLKPRRLELSDLSSSRSSRQSNASSLDDLKPLSGPARGRQSGRRKRKNFWTRLSTRWKIVIIVLVLAIIGVVIGVPVAEHEKAIHAHDGDTGTWKPAIGSPWNIQLNSAVTPANISALAAMYDIDLFENTKSTIDELHTLNRKIICYFSAGTLESYRSDASSFPSNVLGNTLADFPDEKWLDTRSQSVRDIMIQRLDMAVDKGCDGVDPDNIDGYTYDSGFALTSDTAIDYITFLAAQAHSRKLSIGLKNGGDLVNSVVSNMDWAIVEQCAEYNECGLFTPFVAAGRPVFRIEYVNETYTGSAEFIINACGADGSRGMSTLIKTPDLDSWFDNCPITYGGATVWA